MQQYIYGNLHHAGFRTVSSDTTGFFSNHSDVLSPLMYYDTASTHGELKQGAHKCFWMLTTDLKIPGGQDYLFIQESGMDPYRAAAVVQGYRSDHEDADLYGPDFLTLFGTRFVSNQEAMGLGEENLLQSLPFAQLPRDEIQPEPIPRELLQGVLLALFRKKRVIIRIPFQGAEAMSRSRRYLKAIYQCLPYEKRRNNGCITGATEDMLGISKAFRIYLMDGDADTADIATDSYQSFFDAAAEAPVPRRRQEDEPYYPLAVFLTDASQQERDSFFRYCREALREDGITGDPDIKEYAVLLSEYRLGEKPLSGREIPYWAESLYNKERAEERSAAIRKKISAALPVGNLLAYLCSEAVQYASVHRFGILQDADEETQDQNGALTLQMMTGLPEYDCGAVRDGLREHFVSLATEACPALTSEKPTKDTVQACMDLARPGPHRKRSPWTNALLEDIREALDTLSAHMAARYEQNYTAQKAEGEALIRAFTGWDLEKPYKKLQGYYLYNELTEGWNEVIGQRIPEICSPWPNPRTLEGCGQLQEQLRHMREVFAANNGSFTDRQAQILGALDEKWGFIPALAARRCETAQQLEQWIREADTADCHPELREELKRSQVNALFARIPEDLELEELEKRLQCAVTYGNLLEKSRIAFDPWGVKAEPQALLDQIGMLKAYPNGGVPKLNNRKLCRWITRALPQNKDLMILLIREQPENQKELVAILAKKGQGITQGDIRELYLAGCARSLLLGQSQDASAQWRKAVEAFLPELPHLPEPVKARPPQKQTSRKVLPAAALILLGLAAALPGAVLLLTGGGSPVIWGVLTAVTGLCAAIFGAAAFVPKMKPARGILLGAALALVPGILACAAGLILGFL